MVTKALVALAVLLAPLLPGEPPTPSPVWGPRADAVIDRAVELDAGAGEAFHYAWLASAVANRHGWDDPRARTYLDRVLAMRHADGGWGLTYAWDAFSDGTVNPADTTYTVTLAAHVGPVLLEAHRAGVVSAAVIHSLINKLHSVPLVPVSFGYCVAYSEASTDVRPGYCVHNVNAAAALFLRQAETAGFPVSQWWITNITRQEVYTYLQADRSWKYTDGRPGLNDWPHNALSVEAALSYAPGIGRDALTWMMTRTGDAYGWYGHLALARFDCTRALNWVSEYDTAIVAPANQTFGMLSQASRLVALAAKECDS